MECTLVTLSKIYSTSLVKSTTMVAAAAVLVLIATIALWGALGSILATNKGIDLTDEGLYLLAANPPEQYAAWGFPFGWHTGPLFGLVGFDIASFRTLGAFLLLMAGLWAGYHVGALAWCLGESSERRNQIGAKRSIFIGLSCAIGALGSLLYYAGFLRTPSYNWLSLLGMLIACGGYFALLRVTSSRPRPISYLYAGGVALGLFCSLPGKASVAPLTFVWGWLLLALFMGVRKSFQMSFIIGAQVVILISIALWTGLWAPNFPDYFLPWVMSDMPKFVPSHSVFGAVVATALIPWEFVNALFSSPAANLAWISVAIVAVSQFEWLQRRFPYIPYIFATIAAGACMLTAKIPQAMVMAEPAARRFTYSPAVTATILIAILVLVLAWKSFKNPGQNIKVALLFLALLLYPTIFSFGTSTSPYAQSAMALVFIALAAVVAGGVMLPRNALYSSAGVLLFVVLLVAATVKDSWRAPYRMLSMAEQTVPITFGQQGLVLFVDKMLAETLLTLREEAVNAGCTPGTPLLGVCWSWSTTIPYFLEGKVPNSLILTLFGYPTSVAVGRYIVDKYLPEYPADQAWILTGDITKISSESPHITNQEATRREQEQRQILSYVSNYSSKRFPEDYELVSEVASVALWKPRR